MSKLSDQIDWACTTFNTNVKNLTDRNGTKFTTEAEAIEANMGLLFYVKKIYPKGIVSIKLEELP